MKHVNKFLDAMNTLLSSWGGDTPPDATWAANELLDWVEIEYGVKISKRYHESCDGEEHDEFDENGNDLIKKELKELFKQKEE